jgi:hypothetical protein
MIELSDWLDALKQELVMASARERTRRADAEFTGKTELQLGPRFELDEIQLDVEVTSEKFVEADGKAKMKFLVA